MASLTSLELDPRFTFGTFIVGAGNRLAAAAARRVAETPADTYNPLFIYSASGLGKTHLLMAIGNEVRRLHPDLQLRYDTLERFMDEVIAAIEAGERESFRARLGRSGVLLLDDVQFLAGRHRTQEELLRVWDVVFAQGGQVVLASDRPPPEIDGLDDRLLSRFSGGLIVDIGAPEYETRVAIVRRKAEERGQKLDRDVAEALARIVFGNVRELQGALNRLLAAQELEGRPIGSTEVAALLGRTELSEPEPPRATTGDEFGDFLQDMAGAVNAALEFAPAERRLTETVQRWREAGFSTRRLESALQDPTAIEEAEAVVTRYESDVERLRAIVAEIDALEPSAPELTRGEVFRDPDRLEDAEALLAQVRERTFPLPAPPATPTFEMLALPADAFGLRAARAVAEQPGTRYNPLFLHGADRQLGRGLLTAIGNQAREAQPELPVALIGGQAFASELIQAIEKNHVESWRARYHRARLLLLDGVDALENTDRAQEELFHLFEQLLHNGAQLVFSADRPPGELNGIDERLRSRLGSGLVAELPVPARPGADAPAAAEEASAQSSAAVELLRGVAALVQDEWFLSREKLLWEWPYDEDRLVETLE